MKIKVNTLRQHDKLKSKKQIDAVLLNGKTLVCGDLRLRYLSYPSESSPSGTTELKVAFSVAKRVIPLAINRNKIKRQMREVYRLIKSDFYQKCHQVGISVHLFFSYRSTQKPKFEELKSAINSLMQSLSNRIFVDIEDHR